MRKFTLSALAAIAISLSGLGVFASEMKETTMTYSINGVVLDETTGEALAGVKVEIDNTGVFTYSDFDGNFMINGLLPGSYKISSTYISYNTNELEVNLETENLETLEVKLDQVSKQ